MMTPTYEDYTIIITVYYGILYYNNIHERSIQLKNIVLYIVFIILIV